MRAFVGEAVVVGFRFQPPLSPREEKPTSRVTRASTDSRARSVSRRLAREGVERHGLGRGARYSVGRHAARRRRAGDGRGGCLRRVAHRASASPRARLRGGGFGRRGRVAARAGWGLIRVATAGARVSGHRGATRVALHENAREARPRRARRPRVGATRRGGPLPPPFVWTKAKTEQGRRHRDRPRLAPRASCSKPSRAPWTARPRATRSTLREMGRRAAPRAAFRMTSASYGVEGVEHSARAAYVVVVDDVRAALESACPRGR